MKRKNIMWINIYKSLFLPGLLIASILGSIALIIAAGVFYASFDKAEAKRILKGLEWPW
jgi:hypothetical protein